MSMLRAEHDKGWPEHTQLPALNVHLEHVDAPHCHTMLARSQQQPQAITRAALTGLIT